MPTVLRVENLSKLYQVDHAGPRGRFGYRTLREDLVNWVGSPWKRLRGEDGAGRCEDFWALKDVGFEVRAGEVLGVIGRNGAGKSTLLKILSRVTRPTAGHIDLYGRVGSLLEVGTGFHPELTGRENISLNGAILGMSRREIARKFAAIVDFAEVERFLDLPVKRYSSGMYVRLAFAVAAYLEPEILIVDEVLAVGDMAFQRKCMGRMREVGRSGCTVLFVSHNMPAIESLCDRALLLDGGRVVGDGGVAEMIGAYRRRVMPPDPDGGAALAGRRSRTDGGPPVFRSVALLDGGGTVTNFLPLGGAFHLRIGLEVPESIEFPTLGVGIDDTMGQRLLTLHTPLSRPAIARVDGRCEVDCRVAAFPLAPGEYSVKLAISALGGEIDEVERVLQFSVINSDAFGEGRGFMRGLCVAPSEWAVVRETATTTREYHP